MAKMTEDPRIELVADTIQRIRNERLRRMIEVRDMRKSIGRVTIKQEARAIVEELDRYDARMFDAAAFCARVNAERSDD